MNSFIYILRSCALYFPSFFKIVLTLKTSPENHIKTGKIIELLGSKTIIEIKDKEIFETEGKSYLEFALSYQSSTSSKMLSASPDIMSGDMIGMRGGGSSLSGSYVETI
jgi:hypothetical protein